MAKPAGVYDTAEAWVEADIAWQLANVDNKVKLDKPLRRMFKSDEDHANAIEMRKVVCTKPDHVGDRVLVAEQRYGNVCKACKTAHQNAKKAAERPPKKIYKSKDEFMTENAHKTSEAHPEIQGDCRLPKPDEFEKEEVYIETYKAAEAWSKTYHQQYAQIPKIAKKYNAAQRVKYNEENQTAEGQQKHLNKSRRDGVNTKKRKQAAEEAGDAWCEYGSHKMTIEEATFCPVADLGIGDYKGTLGRIKRGVCRAHFPRTLQKWRYFDAKYRNDTLLRVRFRLQWWRAEMRKDGRTISLTDREQHDLVMSPCVYCKKEPVDAMPNSINILDAACKDANMRTCVTGCTECVMSKRGLMPTEFVHKCKDVAIFQTTGVRATAHIPFRQVLNGVPNYYYGPGTYNTYKTDAVKRNLTFDLTPEEFAAKKRDGCYFCGFNSPVLIGIDRLNNKIGYTGANARGCCTTCNMMKWTKTPEAFVANCIRVHDANA